MQHASIPQRGIQNRAGHFVDADIRLDGARVATALQFRAKAHGLDDGFRALLRRVGADGRLKIPFYKNAAQEVKQAKGGRLRMYPRVVVASGKEYERIGADAIAILRGKAEHVLA